VKRSVFALRFLQNLHTSCGQNVEVFILILMVYKMTTGLRNFETDSLLLDFKGYLPINSMKQSRFIEADSSAASRLNGKRSCLCLRSEEIHGKDLA
jgi:hypothetical protein